MHQPTIETAFRRGSFGMEAALNTPLPTSEAAQQFTEMLNRPDRPIPSRRSSMRAVPNPFIPPPPPPPPATVPVVDPSRLSSMRSPSPVDMSNVRKAKRSPVRPAPLPSSPPRGNSSQAEHFMRSNSGLSPPPSASKRAYSFAREQALRPSVTGISPRPPARTNSCPPDADLFKTRMMRSNSDGYTSASTSFVTEGSSSPTSSDSSQPSDNEDPNIKMNDYAFNLEVESRRLELVWRETEKQWKERYGITLPRSQEMAFRQHVEGGIGHKDDGPKEKEWRDMWKNTNASWSEFEARWRQEEAQKRRNDDTHFHTAHSDPRGMAFADDDKVMNTIFTHFEKEMEKRRQRAERKRLEEVQQAERDRKERERTAWQATVDRESESRRSSGQGIPDNSHGLENWVQERLLRPDLMRNRSSSVVVESRPAFQRSRSGSVATIIDPLSETVPPPPPPPFIPPQLDASHTRPKHKRSSRGSRESFGSVGTEEDSQRAEEHRAEDIKRHYMDAARRQYYSSTPTDNAWGPSARPDKPRHEQRPHTETSELPRVQEERSIPATPHPDSRPSPSFAQDAPPATPGLSPSLEEHLKILEREQAELARRIQELRAAAEGAKSPAPPAEPDRGREKDKPKDKEREKPKGEPRAKSQGGRKHQDDEGGMFKAMQERLREAEGRRAPEKVPDAARKPKRATLATLETEPAAPIRVPAGDADTSASRVHFASSKPSVEDLPSPTPPRVRTPGPGPRVMTPARVRTPSPRSQSPVGAPSIASSNATRDTASTNDIASTVHEAVAREAPLKIQTTPVIQPAPRPALKSRDTNAERPKSGTNSTLAVPHVNTSSSSPVESVHNQDVSPMGVKTPRATNFDPDRTPRAQSGPVPEQAEKAEPAPRVYISPNQARARAEGTTVRVEEETAKRRVDVAMGATVAAAAAEAFDRAGGKKRSKEAEMRAQEERRATEEQLAREQRRAEEERRAREERRAEEARRREAAERREREEQARYEREKREREKQERERQERERQERERQERERQEERRRRWAEPAYERARPPIRENVADAWNSYELRWAALALPSSTQPITFRNIPWPMVGIPAGPEAITTDAVGAFLLSKLHSQDKSRKERLRTAMLRWHSDKFEGRWMARIDEAEQPMVKEAVGAVARALTELMTKPDQY